MAVGMAKALKMRSAWWQWGCLGWPGDTKEVWLARLSLSSESLK